MAQEEQETEYFDYGETLSFYIQKENKIKLDKALAKYQGVFKSRSHLINCAIVRELRRLETAKLEIETE